MNSLIETIFQNFIVDDKKIPVSFMRYNGKSTTYITYMYYDSDGYYRGFFNGYNIYNSGFGLP